jgi:hypothetical protein
LSWALAATGNKIAPAARNKKVERMRNRLFSIDIVGLPFVSEIRRLACADAGRAGILHCLEHRKIAGEAPALRKP